MNKKSKIQFIKAISEGNINKAKLISDNPKNYDDSMPIMFVQSADNKDLFTYFADNSKLYTIEEAEEEGRKKKCEIVCIVYASDYLEKATKQ